MAGGAVSSTPQVFREYLRNGWSYEAEIFLLFLKLNWAYFLKISSRITLPGATPGHRKVGGPFREASHLGEDHNADVLYLYASVLQTATEVYHVIIYTQ